MFKRRLSLKALIVLLCATFIVLTAESGCEESADTLEADGVNDQQNIYTQNQPVPHFDWSLERDVAIQLYQIRNEARNTYTVVTSQGTGTPVWMCPSIGYPIPYDVQLTNPVKRDYSGSYGVVIEQAEPNGLFSSKNSSGTWVLCVGENGKAVPVYTELNATAFAFPVEIVDGMIVPVEGSKPSVTIDLDH